MKQNHSRRTRVRKIRVHDVDILVVTKPSEPKQKVIRTSGPKVSNFAYEMARSHFGKNYSLRSNARPSHDSRFTNRAKSLFRAIGVSHG